MLPQEIIRKKRDGGVLEGDEIEVFIDGLTAGRIGDAQVGAFAMAAFLRGFDGAETIALTRAMAGSGTILTWPGLEGPVVDKHSTGGIGDKVSLILGPLLAACGAYVPMISGRGLGHTGGTLDKLEAIPGYDTAPGLDRFRHVVRETGCAIIGQTPELAPADRRLYAIRDVTGTVESQPLIVSSILSKKLAEGIQTLVMDVKAGSGAFLPDRADAEALARAIIRIAKGAGIACSALLTDMNQCLGRTAGHSLEVCEAIAVLTGKQADPRLLEVTLALAAKALELSHLASGADARRQLESALESGAAAECFARMVVALGGPSDLLEAPGTHLAATSTVLPVEMAAEGVVRAIDARALGLAIIELGGGRTCGDQAIDHAVGLAEVAGVGEWVGPDRPFALVHARSVAEGERAAQQIRAAVSLADPPIRPSPVVLTAMD